MEAAIFNYAIHKTHAKRIEQTPVSGQNVLSGTNETCGG